MTYYEELNFIAEHYGLKNQLKKLIEECNELIAEAEKEELDKEHLTEEIADVEIMIHQIKNLAKLSRVDVDKIKVYKVNRQLDRIAKEKENEKIIIDSAENLKNYCNGKTCPDCLFYDETKKNSVYRCRLFNRLPCYWKIEEKIENVTN